jgi:hypothetical protein
MSGKLTALKIYFRTSFGGQAALCELITFRPFSFASLPFGSFAIIVRMYNVSSGNKRQVNSQLIICLHCSTHVESCQYQNIRYFEKN